MDLKSFLSLKFLNLVLLVVSIALWLGWIISNLAYYSPGPSGVLVTLFTFFAFTPAIVFSLITIALFIFIKYRAGELKLL